MNEPQGGDPLLGTLVGGRYRILEKLGEGAMGAVYVAEHVRIGRRDAIKLLRSELASDAESVARFSRGARIVSSIRHPNVCSIYDFGDTDEGHQFLAMEYVPGGTLRDLLEREGRLPVARALRIGGQIAGALQAAHDAGIIHRDLKPGNVMLATGRDGQDEVKVVDFDIAKVTEAGGEEVTRLGFVVGTPEYMSPEQLMAEPLDGRSDVYSLGLVLYRMLTGILPFKADSLQSLMVGRLTDAPLPLAEALPGEQWRGGLQSLIDRTLERHTQDRISSAAEVQREIAALLAGEVPVPAGPPPAHAPHAQDMHLLPPSGARDLPPTRVQAPAAAVSANGAATRLHAGGRRLAWMGSGVIVALAIAVTGIVLWQSGNGAPDESGQTTASSPEPAGPDLAVTDDSATRSNTSPQTSQPAGRNASAQTESAEPPPTRSTDPPAVTSQDGPGGIMIPSDMARAVLDQQLFRLDPDQPPDRPVLQATIDTATSLWHLQAMSATDRALAAYVIGSAYDLLRNWTMCANWLDSALALNSQGRGYAELRTKCREMRD